MYQELYSGGSLASVADAAVYLLDKFFTLTVNGNFTAMFTNKTGLLVRFGIQADYIKQI
jgi:hypothetical protein